MARYLTERQKEILEFIGENVRRRGVSPTHREICEHFGYSSYGTVHKHLKLLENKGFLRRHWNQKRGVELTGEAAVAPELPFLGLIAAGKPIEALAGNEHIEVPPHLIAGGSGGAGGGGSRLRRGSRAEHYVLKVRGDSMIEEGIHDGDLVVVQRREEASPGEMVVALVGEEATLKRFYPEGAEVRLQPSNPAMEAIRVPARDVMVQGIVVGLMRRF